MKNPETIKLHEIYNNLSDGYKYGFDVENVRFPYFSDVIHMDKNYIYWTNYGSSANKKGISELKWIINVIFKMTAIEFSEKYIIDKNSKYRFQYNNC